MSEFGLNLKHDTGGKRIEVQCEHQNGLIYIVPSEASWVCSEELLHAHALAGFFRQLVELDDPNVKDLMQKWGIYYRPRAIVSKEGESTHSD
jgi:hypothetical protein